MKNVPIVERREFYDIPRRFVVLYEGEHFLFESPFDPELDEFASDYRVFRMGVLPQAVLDGSWDDLAEFAVESLGRIPTQKVQFDETRRRWIDARVRENTLLEKNAS